MQKGVTKDWGRGIKMAMASKGFNNIQLAELMGVSDQTIANWRNGKRIRLHMLEELAGHCGLTFDELSEYSTVEEAKAGS
jgi:transcriptional regulator with XRE-family HTH domain